MRSQEFISINRKEKMRKVDFPSDTESAFSAFFEKGRIFSGADLKVKEGFFEELPSAVNPVKIYDTALGILFFCTDGRLYLSANGKLKKLGVPPLDLIPKVFSCVFFGKKAVVITACKKAFVYDGGYSVITIPKGDAFAFYQNRLFIAGGERVFVMDDKLQTECELSIPKKSGRIIKLLPSTNGLFAITKSAFYVIKRITEESEFSLGKAEITCGKIDGESAAIVDDKIVFTSQGRLFAFDVNSEKTKEITGALFLEDYAICGDGVSYNDCYILPVLRCGQKLIYVYDFGKTGECFIPNDDLLLGDNGIVYSKTTGKMMVISSDYSAFPAVRTKRVWKSKALLFEGEKKKILTSLSIKSKCAVEVKVSGDFGTREFSAVAGNSVARINAVSRGFTVELSFYGGEISELTLYYKE